MRVFVLVALPAKAQERDPITGERIILVGGAVMGWLAVGLIGPFIPITVVAATYGTSAALGLDPSLRGVVLDTAIGMGLGTAAFLYWTQVEGYDADFGTSIGSFFVTVAVGSVATGLIHGARIRVPTRNGEPVLRLAPAALAAQRSTGLSL